MSDTTLARPGWQPKMLAGKSICTADEAVADMKSGDTIAVGGFGTVRNRANQTLDALARRDDVKDLIAVANGFPHQPLAAKRMVKKFIGAFGASVYGRANSTDEQIRDGTLEFEPSPQGIFTERLRAGAAGIPAFYSPVGVHTVVADGKERRTIDGKEYILETAIKPDYGFVRAMKADELGNLTGIGSTWNFHPAVAAASRITIAEVDEIVPTGSISPEDVKIPGIFVDRIVLHDPALDEAVLAGERTTRARQRNEPAERVGIPPDLMAMKVASMFKPGDYVNLGMGLPTLVSNYIPEGVQLHAENGFLGYGRKQTEEENTWWLYNASADPVIAHEGASFFDSVLSFTMARGGHLDAVVLGGMQVSAGGDLANWWAPFMVAGGMGGAMDLCTDVPELIVMMDHVTRDGEMKILDECVYPLTGKACVTKIVTDLALIEVTPEGLVLREVAPGVSPEYVQERTQPKLIVAPDCKEMEF
jgi:3-oxoacid CoA-transferase